MNIQSDGRRGVTIVPATANGGRARRGCRVPPAIASSQVGYGSRRVHARIAANVMLSAALIGPGCGLVPAMAEEYFVDCVGGDDEAAGTGPESAWRSLTKVNALDLLPGDAIRLRRGTSCSGMLRSESSGSPGDPISVAAYDTGPRPIINASDHQAAIRLFNAEHWHIKSIETIGGNPFGIYISGDVAGVLEHFRIENVLVHHVEGTANNKESGLIVITPGSALTTFNDVIIDGVTAHSTNQWSGILVGGDDYGGTPDSPRSTNIIVRNSTVHNVDGDGIILFQVDNGLIENSVAYSTGLAPTATVGTPNGIWTWMCGSCTVQFNEVYWTHSPGVDGGAFDIDYGCSDNVVQYNYAHDSSAYCVAVFGAWSPTVNSIVRYNICANNGRDPAQAHQGEIYLRTWGGGSIDGIRIYNNTLHWTPAESAYVLNARDAVFRGERPRGFKNNILYSDVAKLVALPDNSGFDLDHNVYWSAGTAAETWWTEGMTTVTTLDQWQARGHDAHSRFTNPLFSIDGDPGIWPPEHRFLPRIGSPTVNTGTDVGDMGEVDFGGKPIPYGAHHDIGALEWRPRPRRRHVDFRQERQPRSVP